MVKPVDYIADQNVLFLDLSSSCSGWCVANFNKEKRQTDILDYGAFWFVDDDTLGFKYNKVAKFIKELCKLWKIKTVLSEAYFSNPYKSMGTNVVAELHGVIRSELYNLEEIPVWLETPPQTWRSAGLGVKKDASKAGSSAWKFPTKIRVEEVLNFKFPEKIKSNLNDKMRKMPTDVIDAIGICIGYLSLEPNGCKIFRIEEIKE